MHTLSTRQEESKCFIEAAFILLLHADLLSFDSTVVKAFSIDSISFNEETSFERKVYH